MRSYDKCENCGGEQGIHHYRTAQCPVGGVESPVGREQEYKTSTFKAPLPFDSPARLAKDMTVLEYFAAMAMQGLMTTEICNDKEDYQAVAISAVNAANALIEALNREAN